MQSTFVRKVALLGIGLAVALANNSVRAEQLHPASGLSIISSSEADHLRSVPTKSTNRKALTEARREVERSPQDFSYPWVDANGDVHVRYVTPRGVGLAKAIDRAGIFKMELMKRSFGELEAIKHDVPSLRAAGIPDADLIWRTAPDEKNGRVIISVSRLSDRLLDYLAKTYGKDAIAIVVAPKVEMDIARTRWNRPYPGGELVMPPGGGACTIGFAWTYGWITAGHCASSGGGFGSSDGRYIGNTAPSVDENWTDGVGTVLFPNAGTMRGDLALIRQDDPSYNAPYMYYGGPNATYTLEVAGMNPDSVEVGDQFCTGGAVTGQVCGWVVTCRACDIGPLKSGGIARNEVFAHRFEDGKGVIKGDSGGPVYTLRLDFTVNAAGIISLGDEYSESGTPVPPPGTERTLGFTDIWHAYWAFPGTLKTKTYNQVTNRNSRKCLDVRGATSANGAEIIQWPCTGGQNQRWHLEPHPVALNAVRIRTGYGKCLAIGSGSTVNGAKAIQWDCYDESYSQAWTMEWDGSLRNGSGKCLAIGSGSLADGAKAIQWDCTGSPAQAWDWH